MAFDEETSNCNLEKCFAQKHIFPKGLGLEDLFLEGEGAGRFGIVVGDSGIQWRKTFRLDTFWCQNFCAGRRCHLTTESLLFENTMMAPNNQN